MVSAGVNHRDIFFEFQELTKLQGEPNPENLLLLRNQLKTNAKNVFSNLSDGQHGHLALVLSDARHALITAQPFVRPVFPGPLVIPAGTNAAMATVLRDAHHEEVRIFREAQGVEAALIKQIVEAVDSPYLTSLRDRTSNSLTGAVFQILHHLFTVHGHVSPQMVDDKDDELRKMLHNPQDPIDLVFNAVEDQAEHAEMGDQELSVSQTIAKACVTLNKTRRFKQPITDWNRRPAADKTWINFKVAFRLAHQEFRETTNVTLEESELERNNAHLVQQVVNGMQQHLSDETATNEATMLQMSNSATQASETQAQLQAQLQQMQQSMHLLQAQVANNQAPNHQEQARLGSLNWYGQNLNPSILPAVNQAIGQQYQYQQGGYQGRGYQGRGYQGRGYQGRGYQGRGPPGRGYQGRGRGQPGRGDAPRQRNTSIYCWSHGGCGHTSSDCQTPLPGHQPNATFENKMGGSTHRCN
jgi:hypothetical protein